MINGLRSGGLLCFWIIVQASKILLGMWTTQICTVLLANVLGQVDVAVFQERTYSSAGFRITRRVFCSSRDHTRPLGSSFELPMILTMNARRFQRTHPLRGMGDYSLYRDRILVWELSTLRSLVLRSQWFTQCVLQWSAQLALVACLTQALIESKDLPTCATLATHDSHSLKKRMTASCTLVISAEKHERLLATRHRVISQHRLMLAHVDDTRRTQRGRDRTQFRGQAPLLDPTPTQFTGSVLWSSGIGEKLSRRFFLSDLVLGVMFRGLRLCSRRRCRRSAPSAIPGGICGSLTFSSTAPGTLALSRTVRLSLPLSFCLSRA